MSTEERSTGPAHLRAAMSVVIALALASASCSSASTSGDSGGLDATLDTDAGTSDASPPDVGLIDDAEVMDAELTDTAVPDAGSMSSGAACSFNRDCPANERCECDEATGCQCLIGPRGTGQLGVDTCETGEDCASSVCLEGPNDVLVCSGPCTDALDCGGLLPICADIAFVGRICIRDPNG